MSGGLLDCGKLGDTGRLLLMALKGNIETKATWPTSCPLFSQGCFVTTFIEELFAEAEAKRILNSPPDNQADGDPVLSGAIIRFTHFGKMVDDNGPTSDMAYAAFIRCMAIICLSDEARIDCIIPVLLRDEPLCESIMSAILIQFKTKGESKAKYPINQPDMEFSLRRRMRIRDSI